MSPEQAARLDHRRVEDPELAQLRERVMNETIRRQDLEKDIANWRRKYTLLQTDLAEKRRQDKLYPTAVTIWEYWRKHCKPRARCFSEKQEKAVMARLKDKAHDHPDEPAFTPRYICEAILGAKHDHYVDPKGKHHLGLELICSDAAKLQDFHERWERWREKQ